jgi:hypothetical protein
LRVFEKTSREDIRWFLFQKVILYEAKISLLYREGCADICQKNRDGNRVADEINGIIKGLKTAKFDDLGGFLASAPGHPISDDEVHWAKA